MRPDVVDIPASTPMSRLGKQTLVVFEDRCVLLQREGHEFRVFSTGETKSKLLPPVSEERRVGDVVGLEELRQPLRVVSLPEGEVVGVALGFFQNLKRNRALTMFFGTFSVSLMIVMASLAIQGGGEWVMLLVGASLVWFLGTMVYDLSYLKTFMFRVDGRDWALNDLAPLNDCRDIASRQVEDVKEEYGRLLTDLPYRVANPALFDAACPTTEVLTLALFEWDSTWARLDDEERGALASRVVAAFHAARHHAERVGMNHLPPDTRDDARRALGALRIATASTGSPAERTAALEQAVELLDDLALYYLPSGTETREALGGRQLKQLPGRRPM